MGEEGGQKSAFFIYIKKLNVDLNKGPSKGAATSYAVPNPAERSIPQTLWVPAHFFKGLFLFFSEPAKRKNDSVIGAGEAAACWDQQLSRASQHMLKAADFRQVFLQDPFFVCLFLA